MAAAPPLTGQFLGIGECRLTNDELRELQQRIDGTDCDDCGEDVQPVGLRRFGRRRRCFHCGRLVCGYCYHHAHGCAPSHTLAECRDRAKYLQAKNRPRYLYRLRARALLSDVRAARAAEVRAARTGATPASGGERDRG